MNPKRITMKICERLTFNLLRFVKSKKANSINPANRKRIPANTIWAIVSSLAICNSILLIFNTGNALPHKKAQIAANPITAHLF